MITEHENSAIYMQNRELSWLKFNERVLREANRTDTPMIERLKYISIFTSNLDEFFMIRVGALTDYAQFNKKYRDNKTGMSAQEQLEEIFRAVVPLYKLRDRLFSIVLEGLERHGIQLLHVQDLSDDEMSMLRNHFELEVKPLLSPQIIDSRHPFPHIANKQLHIAVKLEKRRGFLFGLIAVPSQMDRIVLLRGGSRFVLLEELIMHFADDIFNIYRVLEKNIIAVTRNADIDTEEQLDEDIDYRLHIKNLLKKRNRLSPVRLELAYPAKEELIGFLCEKLSLRTPQLLYSSTPLDLSFVFSINRMIDGETVKRLIWPAHVPVDSRPTDRRSSLARIIDSGKDLLFSYPYESIEPFLSMIHQSAGDDSVISIKITLYRIDLRSKLAESLILAAENNKEVVVLMELRARFDESNNIDWAQRLEGAGCRVIYGLLRYKVHSKVCLITRKEKGRIRYITQIGTGNYNEMTAKLYTDLSLITANQDIGRDASDFFGNLLLGNLEGIYRHLWVAPNSYESKITECIEEERQKSLHGKQGKVVLKCNSLSDKEIIEKLSAASRDGVRIFLIIRGICCLLPQIPGFTENIRVISIVGKFLEHTRIFCFGEGSDAKVYISSGDLMTRNTERRVEVACPVLDTTHKGRIMGMLDIMIKDNTQAWEQFSDGMYELRRPNETDAVFNSQEYFIHQAQKSTVSTEQKGLTKDAGVGKTPLYMRVLRRILQLTIK